MERTQTQTHTQIILYDPRPRFRVGDATHTILTPDVTSKILYALSQGATRSHAAQYAGISAHALAHALIKGQRAIEREESVAARDDDPTRDDPYDPSPASISDDPDIPRPNPKPYAILTDEEAFYAAFARDVLKEEATCATEIMGTIRVAASHDWKAAQAFLTARFPRHYAARPMDPPAATVNGSRQAIPPQSHRPTNPDDLESSASARQVGPPRYRILWPESLRAPQTPQASPSAAKSSASDSYVEDDEASA